MTPNLKIVTATDEGPLVPVLSSSRLKAWPKHDKGGRVEYVPIGVALSRRYSTDAHTAAWSVPEVARRLDKGAPEKVEHGIKMMVMFADVDGHGVPDLEAWRMAERVKVDALRADHPGVIEYDSRGGYRLVARLATPIFIRDASDAAAWRCIYLSWVRYLDRRYGIKADPACKDWQRLYRLPHATRDEGGKPEDLPIRGSLDAIGEWHPELTAADLAVEEEKTTTAAATEDSRGRLWDAFARRGWLGEQVEPGKWKARCPWMPMHTSGALFDGSTVVYEASAGRDLGWFHCSHAHCDGRPIEEVIAVFTDEEMQNEPDEGELPEIVIGTDEERVSNEAIKALASDMTIYQRGGELVDVVREVRPDGIDRGDGALRVRVLPPARLRERLAANARFVRVKERKDGELDYVPAHPPDYVVKAVGARGRWEGIRALEGVTTAPLMRADGSILSTPGYDRATGLLYQPTGHVDAVPESPSWEEVRAAVKALKEPIRDFPFVSDYHRAAALAAIMTPFARHAYAGPAPLFGIDASTRAAGKSLLADLIATITTNRPMARVPMPADDAEFRKVITASLIAGDPLILIDNIDRVLGCASLDALLTSTTWRDRVLGASRMTAELTVKTTFYATANNLILGADTARRTLHIRLEPAEERPEERSGFAHPDLIGYVRAERPRLAAAALTILRGYHVAGRPDQRLPAWGSFEGWSGLVRNALMWAGEPDPAATRDELQSQADTEARALKLLLSTLEELDPMGGGISVAEMIKSAHDGLKAALVELVPSRDDKPSARRIGMKLHHLRRRVVGGRCLERRDGKVGALWAVKKTAARGD